MGRPSPTEVPLRLTSTLQSHRTLQRCSALAAIPSIERGARLCRLLPLSWAQLQILQLKQQPCRPRMRQLSGIRLTRGREALLLPRRHLLKHLVSLSQWQRLLTYRHSTCLTYLMPHLLWILLLVLAAKVKEEVCVASTTVADRSSFELLGPRFVCFCACCSPVRVRVSVIVNVPASTHAAQYKSAVQRSLPKWTPSNVTLTQVESGRGLPDQLVHLVFNTHNNLFVVDLRRLQLTSRTAPRHGHLGQRVQRAAPLHPLPQ
mmetsp:Transcript_3956/g.12604  ORF Transcript_3956/g.12604 Transcript_3956/m.12604 type:complete len:261 (-) Transcript_3956:348-1130(-)